MEGLLSVAVSVELEICTVFLSGTGSSPRHKYWKAAAWLFRAVLFLISSKTDAMR